MVETRKSLVWRAQNHIELVNSKIPKVDSGSILLKVMACSICGSDLRILEHGNPRVSPGSIVGHEISGVIAEVGDKVLTFNVGDRISVGADVPCGECYHCIKGQANCCDINYAIGHQFEGGFSEYMLLNELTVKYGPIRKLSSSISYDEAALAEPLACCINGFERGFMSSGKTVVIFGAGPIGMMLAELSKIYEASKIIMIEPNSERLGRAKKLGVGGHHVLSTDTNLIDKIMLITNGNGADLTFTACPDAEAQKTSLSLLAKRGVINFFGGLPSGSKPIPLHSNDIHYKEACLTGSHGSTPKQHALALDMIERGTVNVEKLITHRYSLDDIHKAYDKALSGEAIKVVVNPNV